MDKQIEVEGKTYTVKEIKYKDLTGFGEVSQEEAAKKVMLLSAGLTEEEYNDLSLKVGIALQKAINELNGLEDFQKPLTK